jgi:hypothetical protein
VPGQLAGCGGQVTGVSTRRGQLVELARVITASSALLTREQQIFARLTDSLAQLIADGTVTRSSAGATIEVWNYPLIRVPRHRPLRLSASPKRSVLAEWHSFIACPSTASER